MGHQLVLVLVLVVVRRGTHLNAVRATAEGVLNPVTRELVGGLAAGL